MALSGIVHGQKAQAQTISIQLNEVYKTVFVRLTVSP